MKFHFILAMKFCFILAIFGATASPCFASTNCLPNFPYQGGWMGGDSIYSIPLNNNKVLWLFGDSFVRGDKLTTRVNAQMVSNSVAISNCKGKKWQIQYHWREKATKSPQPIFQPSEGFDKYWPKDGFLFQGKLYIFLDKIQKTNEGLGFKAVGTALAKIANPNSNPDNWRVEYLPFASGKSIFPAVSTVIEKPYLYLFSVIEDEQNKSHPIILQRVRLESLSRSSGYIAANAETLAKTGLWQKNIGSNEAKQIIPNGGTEMTVRFHKELNQWVAIAEAPGFPTRQIVSIKSPTLDGPWGGSNPIFDFPEMLSTSNGFDKDTFCYAAKEHTEFYDAKSQNSLITYACNSFKFEKLVSNLEIYRPRAVQVRIPSSP